MAADSYKGSLTSLDFIRAVKAAADSVDPRIDVRGIPLADGGEGTLDAIEFVLGGQRRSCVVDDPLGRPVPAEYLVVGRTAVIEMAKACGLTLLQPAERDPMVASSYGLGQLMTDALNQPDVDDILVGIGGSATNDGGVGMAQALGLRALDGDGQPVRRGGAHLRDIATLDMSQMHPRLHHVSIRALSDVQSPLCGPTGASHMYARQKGASVQDVEVLEANLRALSDKLQTITGTTVADLPGAGAAGGVGAGLVAFCGATLASGIETVLDLMEFDELVQDADLVITGEGRTDAQTRLGKAVLGVARRAAAWKKDVVCVSGSYEGDVDFLYDHGVTACFGICPRPMLEAEAMAQAYPLVQATVENVLRVYGRG